MCTKCFIRIGEKGDTEVTRILKHEKINFRIHGMDKYSVFPVFTPRVIKRFRFEFHGW